MLNSLYAQARQLFHRLFENELIRRVVKNSGYLFSASVFTAAMGMLQSILAARLLGVAAFGVLGVITVFATVLNKLVSFRMSELVVKYVGQFTETNDQPRAAATFKAAAIAELGAGTGVKVMLTELDVDVLPRDPDMWGADLAKKAKIRAATNVYPDGLPAEVQQKLARRYADVFTLFLKHGVERVTFWGVTDATSWLHNFPIPGRVNYPLLWDRDGREKPAFEAVAEVLRTGVKR